MGAQCLRPSQKGARQVLGTCVLLAVVCLWVGSSNLMQVIYKDVNFDKPFFLTYVEASMFSLYLLGFALPSWRRERVRERASLSLEAEQSAALLDDALATPSANAADAEGAMAAADASQAPLTTAGMARIGCVLGILWFLANYCFNASLSLTSVSSTTIISSTSGLFTMLLGSAAGVDSISLVKVAAVALCLLGAVLIGLSDRRNSAHHSLFGDVIALISAVGYGVYVVYLKQAIGHERRVIMPMVFAFAGLTVLLCLWPGLILLNATRVERLIWPDGRVWLFLLINGLLGTVLSDLLWLWAMLLTTPLVATLGLSLSIPVAMVSDALLKGTRFPPVYVVGALLVVLGFVLLNVADAVRARCARASPVQP